MKTPVRALVTIFALLPLSGWGQEAAQIKFEYPKKGRNGYEKRALSSQYYYYEREWRDDPTKKPIPVLEQNSQGNVILRDAGGNVVQNPKAYKGDLYATVALSEAQQTKLADPALIKHGVRHGWNAEYSPDIPYDPNAVAGGAWWPNKTIKTAPGDVFIISDTPETFGGAYDNKRFVGEAARATREQGNHNAEVMYQLKIDPFNLIITGHSYGGVSGAHEVEMLYKLSGGHKVFMLNVLDCAKTMPGLSHQDLPYLYTSRASDYAMMTNAFISSWLGYEKTGWRGLDQSKINIYVLQGYYQEAWKGGDAHGMAIDAFNMICQNGLFWYFIDQDGRRKMLDIDISDLGKYPPDPHEEAELFGYTTKLAQLFLEEQMKLLGEFTLEGMLSERFGRSLKEYEQVSDVNIVAPHDPNEKAGPAGYGDERFVSADGLLPYTIYFENVATASAPAQKVTIIDQLSPNLDWRTFRLGECSVGGTVMEGRSYYTGRMSLGEANDNLLLDAFAGIDVATGKAQWVFTTIDPATGRQPESPLRGFLPPNDETGRGEGYVTFTIRPKPGLATGAVLTNESTIVFDLEDPLTTNTVTLTLDGAAPSSAVAALPEEAPGGGVEVSWSGADDAGGSGLSSCTVYAAKDDGPWEPWLIRTAETSALFTGEIGHEYRFYSVAFDNAGNAEAAPEEPDAAVFMGAGLLDTDGDGMPNAWETGHGLNPRDPSDAAGDADSDGATNLDEYLEGTDPADATVHPFSFSDGFSDGDTAGWTIVDQGYFSAPSAWSIEAGALAQTSAIFTSDDPLRPGTYAWAGDASWKDYYVKATLRSERNAGIGIMFRYTDPDNYYRFSMDRNGGFRRLVKVAGGNATVLAQYDEGYVRGKGYEVEIRADGSLLQAYLDGEKILEASDAANPRGAIGLYSWANAGSWFDNISVVNILSDRDRDGLRDTEDPDDDGDGFSDLLETAMGTDPRSAASTPATLNVNFAPDAAVPAPGFLTDDGGGWRPERGCGWR